MELTHVCIQWTYTHAPKSFQVSSWPRFIPSVVHSVGLDKYIMICIHHYSFHTEYFHCPPNPVFSLFMPSPFPHLKLLQTLLIGLWMLSHFTCVRVFATLWTMAHQASLSMGFSRQEYWSGLPCPSFRGSSQPRDQTRSFYVFCIGRGVLYHLRHLGSPIGLYTNIK